MTRVPGRPRSEKSREAILSAAFELLVDRGYAGFTIEAVAAAAGAGKTTIYRWWPTKSELAVDAFFQMTDTDLRFPETGSAEGDFRAQIERLAELLQGRAGRALAEMLGGARTDAGLGAALGERWLIPRRAWGRMRMEQAAEEGELREGTDAEAALGILYGPLYAPLLFGGTVPSVPTVRAHLNIACKGIFAAGKLGKGR
jgi:AcrR family transcriptional regulator